MLTQLETKLCSKKRDSSGSFFKKDEGDNRSYFEGITTGLGAWLSTRIHSSLVAAVQELQSW